MSSTQFELLVPDKCSYIETGLGDLFFICGSVFNSLGILRANSASGLTYVYDTDSYNAITESRLLSTCTGAIGDTFGEGYYLAGPRYNVNRSDDVRLAKLTVQSIAFFDEDSATLTGVEDEDIVTLSPSDLIPGETELADCYGMVYDSTDDNVIIVVRAGSDSVEWLVKLSTVDGSVQWRTRIDSGIVLNGAAGWSWSRLDNGTIGMVGAPGGTETANAWRTTTGELIYSETGWTHSVDSSGAMAWDSVKGIALAYDDPGNVQDIHKFIFFRGTGDGAGLDDIVEDICNRVGLANSDIDVSDLSGIIVPGYVISRQTTARAPIEQLASIYFFDGVESDYVLKFTLRDGKSVSANLLQEDLAPLDEDTGEFIRESRIQEVELPSRFTLTYMSKENDNQQAAHSSRRVLNPETFRTMQSMNEINLNVPVVLTSTVAKQMTEKALISSWNERSSYSSRISWEYLTLDPQ
jgi:hypothetical protein